MRDASRSSSYADDDSVHESVDVCALELGPATVHHEFGVSPCEQY